MLAEDVEEILVGAPGVADCGVSAMTDAFGVTRVACGLVCKPNWNQGQFLEYCERRMPRDFLPQKFVVLRAIPRSQREAALAVNDEVIARYGNELSTSAEKDVALAMSNRAVQLDKLGRRDEELREQLGLTGAKVIGDVSNLPHPREGQEARIRAGPLLKERGIPAKALLVGDGVHRAPLRA